MDTTSQIRVSDAGAVCWVQFHNPPEHLFTLPMVIDLESLVREREKEGRTRVIVLTGSEPGHFIKHFDASHILRAAESFRRIGLGSPPVGLVLLMGRILGLFVRLFPDLGDRLSLKLSTGLMSGLVIMVRFFGLLERMERSPILFVAAIGGNCMGGACELVLACDFRFAVARDGILIGHPEPLAAMPPAGGGSQRLPRAIGVGRAAAMILDGRPVMVGEALRIGLVHDAYPPETFEERVNEHANRLATRAPQVNRAVKHLLYRGTRLPYGQAFLEEQKAVLATSTTDDALDGLRVYTRGEGQRFATEEEQAAAFYEGRVLRFKGG